MKWFALAALAALGLLSTITWPKAMAQPYPSLPPAMGFQGRGTPALSPYLNMFRGGNPAANYFMGVLPEANRRLVTSQQNAAIFNLQDMVETPPTAETPLAPREDALGPLQRRPLPPTGDISARDLARERQGVPTGELTMGAVDYRSYYGNYGGYYNLPAWPASFGAHPGTIAPRRR